ncbi:hypothetical protein [Natronorubrum texcoconense]|uniref:Uncharacterized protein n=1 Tax=Natronorubrum texcoconense TaxID=1095776 RepID=A0A1G8XUC1_9EURY|nr:hypothetical protein [Natronorubrum texcoconense]SDJ94179.1 hypothetical protein SAMN04515672_1907 [Natronorubrum texcoconense]
MGIERFVRLNLVLVPVLAVAFYLLADYLPLILLPLGVGYLTFAVLISLAWGLSQLSMSFRSS